MHLFVRIILAHIKSAVDDYVFLFCFQSLGCDADKFLLDLIGSISGRRGDGPGDDAAAR